ncbi:PLP-dependent transferase [Nesterenkonia sp. NBAIMH1]|uniref:PLP-dependent transferase n=1 Tax=Nesterenkonia sp. NBAIMH1 TaxID=2600320 RepID=UPI0011B57000|nr:PLP-dependent transferase [Nesterenkonia sp. NBAIMH1]
MTEFETRLLQAAADTDAPTPALEQTLASLESGHQARAVAHGPDALALAVLHVAEPGTSVLVTPSMFAGNRETFVALLPRYGVDAEVVEDPDDAASWAAHLSPSTAALLGETIADPRGDVFAFAEISELARQADAALIIDNTLATPFLARPVEQGADLVVHTSLDLLAGRGGQAGGVIVDAGTVEPAAREQLTRAPAGYPQQVRLPDVVAEQVIRGLESLAARVRQQNETAQRIAEHLQGRPGVHRAYYAGLETSPCAERARDYLPAGVGAALAFEVRAGRSAQAQHEAAQELVRALRVFSRRGSTGGIRALADHPAGSTHARLADHERDAAGIRPGMVRLFVGLEHADDLIADLDASLEACAVADDAYAASGALA